MILTSTLQGVEFSQRWKPFSCLKKKKKKNRVLEEIPHNNAMGIKYIRSSYKYIFKQVWTSNEKR